MVYFGKKAEDILEYISRQNSESNIEPSKIEQEIDKEISRIRNVPADENNPFPLYDNQTRDYSPDNSYTDRLIDSRQDFTKALDKKLDTLPETIMGGILGFTYLGQGRMTLRDDLIRQKEMVDLHETIHTPDEYETRILTEWMMQRDKPQYQN